MQKLDTHEYDALYEEAVRVGLATPEEVVWMREHGIRPATQPWRGPREPVKLRPWWLAFLLRTWDRLTGKRPFFDGPRDGCP
jgi:hypothetical protein